MDIRKATMKATDTKGTVPPSAVAEEAGGPRIPASDAEDGIMLAPDKDTPEDMVISSYLEFLEKNDITRDDIKEVLQAILDEDADPAAIVEARGMKQVSDTGALEAIVDEVLAANPDKVEAYRGGKTGLLGFFVGQCMKATRGQGNPKLINQLLTSKLD